MTPVDDELQALRVRAYGPNADIHLDSQALLRLRELESAVDEQESSGSDPGSERVSAPVEHPATAPGDEDDGYSPEEPLRSSPRVRRSTLLLVIGLTVIATIIVAALVLVQRVHTNPLQADADQVARLALDPAYEIPRIFVGSAAERDNAAQGFQEFYGLRVVLDSGAIYGFESDDACLNIYSSADITDPSSDTFSARFRSGCGAGAFPAMVQFETDGDGLPAELRSAFPKSTALQFVYDNTHNEVIVFVGR